MEFATLFGAAIIAHILADFFFQTRNMAAMKSDLCNPDGWLHGGWHLFFLLFVFPGHIAFLLALSHILIDTRRPLHYYRKFVNQDTEGGPGFVCFAFAQDQAAHLLMLWLATLWMLQ